MDSGHQHFHLPLVQGRFSEIAAVYGSFCCAGVFNFAEESSQYGPVAYGC